MSRRPLEAAGLFALLSVGQACATSPERAGDDFLPDLGVTEPSSASDVSAAEHSLPATQLGDPDLPPPEAVEQAAHAAEADGIEHTASRPEPVEPTRLRVTLGGSNLAFEHVGAPVVGSKPELELTLAGPSGVNRHALAYNSKSARFSIHDAQGSALPDGLYKYEVAERVARVSAALAVEPPSRRFEGLTLAQVIRERANEPMPTTARLELSANGRTRGAAAPAQTRAGARVSGSFRVMDGRIIEPTEEVARAGVEGGNK